MAKDQLDIPRAMGILRRLLDLRTPLSLTDDDCIVIGKIVAAAAAIAATAA